jgi:hypothetical protein
MLLRGATFPNQAAKLTPERVRYLRKLWREHGRLHYGHPSQQRMDIASLAAAHGVSYWAMWRAVRGDSWREVGQEGDGTGYGGPAASGAGPR